MTYTTLKIPVDEAVKYLTSELSSYAYNERDKILMFLEEFFYDENGHIQVKAQSYPMGTDNELSKLFTTTNPIIPGIAFINVNQELQKEESKEIWIAKANDILIKLTEYRANTTSVAFNTPVFNDMGTNESSSKSTEKVVDGYKDPSERDIVINTRDHPMKTGYSPETDTEVL